MVDVVEKSVRARMMAGIRSKNTHPEMIVRRYLHAMGFRFRIHVRTLPGTPDIVLPKYRLVILVHGCFWHRHFGCPLTSSPDDSTGKWARKFSDTMVRDNENIAKLLAAGWRVFVIWECGLPRRTITHNLDWLPSAIQNVSVQILEWPAIRSDEVMSCSIAKD